MYIFKKDFFYIGYFLFFCSFLLPSYTNGSYNLNGFYCTYYSIWMLKSKSYSFDSFYIIVMGLSNFVILLYPLASIVIKKIYWYSLLMIISTLWIFGYLFFQNSYHTLSIGYYCWVLSYSILSFGSLIPPNYLSMFKFSNIVAIVSIFASFIAIYSFFTGNFSYKTNNKKYEDTIAKIFPMILEDLPDITSYLTDMFNKKLKPPKGQSKIYVTHLTFMDPTTGSSMFQTEFGHLINDAIINGIRMAQKTNHIIMHNERDHSIYDTDSNNNKLVNIIFDPNLTKSDKITKIIIDMMLPNNVNVIVTGQFIDKGEIIEVRPLTIVEHDQKVVTKVATYRKKDFVCSAPDHRYKTVLCTAAYEEISKIVQELLEAL